MASQKARASASAVALRAPLYRGALKAHWMQDAQRYFGSMDFSRALRYGRDAVLNCGDGGTPGFVRLPITLCETDKVVEFCRVSRVTAIHRHDDCGAEKIFAGHHGLDGTHAVEFIDRWYDEVSRRTNLPIGRTLILRPQGFHPEPIIVYDGLGINAALLPGAPMCFQVSRLHYPDNKDGAHDAAGHCGTYTDLMFGNDYGLGDRLDANTPGIILVVGNPRAGLPYDKLKEELAGINRHRLDRLIVTGFDYHPR